MFADDEKSLQEVMKNELPRMGHDVTVCADGLEAVAALERQANALSLGSAVDRMKEACSLDVFVVAAFFEITVDAYGMPEVTDAAAVVALVRIEGLEKVDKLLKRGGHGGHEALDYRTYGTSRSRSSALDLETDSNWAVQSQVDAIRVLLFNRFLASRR